MLRSPVYAQRMYDLLDYLRWHTSVPTKLNESHASKGGRRWRYYVSRAALTGRKQDAGSIVRIAASEIENRVAVAVGAHLAGKAGADDDGHINHPTFGGGQTTTQDPPTKIDVRMRRRA